MLEERVGWYEHIFSDQPLRYRIFERSMLSGAVVWEFDEVDGMSTSFLITHCHNTCFLTYSECIPPLPNYTPSSLEPYAFLPLPDSRPHIYKLHHTSNRQASSRHGAHEEEQTLGYCLRSATLHLPGLVLWEF
jgi:hypothetical protein